MNEVNTQAEEKLTDRFDIGNKFYLIELADKKLQATELIVVGFNQDDDELILSDKDGDKYEIYEDCDGDLRARGEFVNSDHMIAPILKPSGVRITETLYLDGRDGKEDLDNEPHPLEGLFETFSEIFGNIPEENLED